MRIREAEALRLRLDEATQTGKRRLMAELKQAGLKDLTGLDIANAFRALDIEQYSLNQHEDLLRRLVAHFRQGEPG